MPEQDLIPDSKGSSGWLKMVLVLVPLFYVLSIGPVAAVVSRRKSPQGMQLLENIYAPVIWLHDHTMLEKPLEAYVEMWGVK